MNIIIIQYRGNIFPVPFGYPWIATDQCGIITLFKEEPVLGCVNNDLFWCQAKSDSKDGFCQLDRKFDKVKSKDVKATCQLIKQLPLLTWTEYTYRLYRLNEIFNKLEKPKSSQLHKVLDNLQSLYYTNINDWDDSL